MTRRLSPFMAFAVAACVSLCLGGWYARADTPALARGTVWDTATLADANVFATALVPSDISALPNVAFRMTIALASTDSIVDLRVEKVSGAGTERSLALNGGAALVAGQVYTFVFSAAATFNYNIRCRTGTTVAYLVIEEIQDGGL
jgi:hypothetical protein